MESAVRSARIEPAIIADRLETALSASEDFQYSKVAERCWPNRNPFAGNGIFGCRDGRPKIPGENVNVARRPGTLKIGCKIPAETASFRSTAVSAVREDWMVVDAVGCEPVSASKIPVMRSEQRNLKED
jgi:hypothetical protein